LLAISIEQYFKAFPDNFLGIVLRYLRFSVVFNNWMAEMCSKALKSVFFLDLHSMEIDIA
jgi:hypothetical protein